MAEIVQAEKLLSEIEEEKKLTEPVMPLIEEEMAAELEAMSIEKVEKRVFTKGKAMEEETVLIPRPRSQFQAPEVEKQSSTQFNPNRTSNDLKPVK